MDPADKEQILKALAAQGQTIGRHDQGLQEVMDAIRSLSSHVTELGAKLSQVSGHLATTTPVNATPDHTTASQALAGGSQSLGPPLTVREPYIPSPQPYSGDPGTCSSFLLKCDLVFEQQPLSYATERSRIAYIMGLLTLKASEWATAAWTSNSPFCHSYVQFVTELKRVFDHPIQGKEAGQRLFSLRQGSSSVSQYSVNFRIVATESRWDEAALRGAFFHGLNEDLKDELAARDESADLETLISLAIRIDNRLRERRRERASRASFSSGPPQFVPPKVGPERYKSPSPPIIEEPMQLGRLRLDAAERQRRRQSRLCFYCGSSTHFRNQCNQAPKDEAHQ